MSGRTRRRRSGRPVGLGFKSGASSWHSLISGEELPRFSSSLDPFQSITTTKAERDRLRRAQKPRERFPRGGRGVITPLSAKRLRRLLNPRLATRHLFLQSGFDPWRTLHAGVRFANPARVLTCVARKVRREVLFALDRAGYRGSGPGSRRPDGRMYRRDASSNYGC